MTNACDSPPRLTRAMGFIGNVVTPLQRSNAVGLVPWAPMKPPRSDSPAISLSPKRLDFVEYNNLPQDIVWNPTSTSVQPKISTGVYYQEDLATLSSEDETS